MADLPQIPGSSGPPQIPGGSSYTAGPATARTPEVPITPATVDAERAVPSTVGPQTLRRKRGRGRRILGPFRVVHLVIAVVIALVGMARNAPEVKTPDITVPKIDVPRLGNTDATGGSDASPVKVPAATVYRAAPGGVNGHPRTIIELGVRRDRIRWVAASRFPTQCTDGTSSSGLVLYTDEGEASGGAGRRLTYRARNLTVRFTPNNGRGTFSYRSERAGGTCRGEVTFRGSRASSPVLARNLLEADRRAAQAFGGD